MYVFKKFSAYPLNFWHSSDHEPNVHFLAHAPRGARTPRGMNAKNRTRRLESVDSDQKRLKEALLWRESESLGVTVSVESEQLRKNRESPSEVSMCGVSAQQWPSTQITVTLFQTTRPNAWFDAVMTPVDKKRVNPCLLQYLFLEGVQQQTNSSQNPRKRSLRHVTNVTNSKFRCWHRVTLLAILMWKKIAKAQVTLPEI